MFRRQPNHDQRHAIGVARDVQARLADTPYADDPRWLSAALLHDIGKLDSHLGVYGRVVATVSGAAVGRDHAEAWSESTRLHPPRRRLPAPRRARRRPHPPRRRARGGGAVGRRPPRPVDLARPSDPARVVVALDAADND